MPFGLTNGLSSFTPLINEFGVQWPFLDLLSTTDLVVIINVIAAYGWCFNG